MLDILSHVVEMSPDTFDKRSIGTAGRAIALINVKQVIDKSNRDPYTPLFVEEPSTLAVDLFSSGIHRAPILNKELNIIGSLSQSDIIKWLYEQSNTYLKNSKVFKQSINELGLGQVVPISVRKDNIVIDVLKVINEHDISAVPVVDDEGKLVGNFSVTDLKKMYTETWISLNLTIYDYLSKHSPSSLINQGLSSDYTTLHNVLEYFNTYPYHRVWILDNDKPLGVISHTDIMKLIKNYSN
jgi:predicted transcriptional regulator